MAGTDCGVNFGAGLAVEIVMAVGRQARYCYQFHDLVKDMGDEQENLISTKDDMQSQFGNDSTNNKDPSRSLQGKVKKATELIDEVESLKGKAEAKKSCCHGVCPNWLCRYIVGKKAAKKTEAMKQLNDELGQKLPRALRSSLQAKHLPEDFIPFQSTTKARDEILKALKDDNNIRIGLHGTGGCGKSYLLRAIHKEVEDVKFKLYRIAFVQVTNPPDVLDIQNSIAIWIGLKFKREKTVGDRGATLSQAFKQDKKYLIILDNVWQVLKFEEIGIPVGENCKVLLSTRQRQIFDYMKFDSVIDLSLLTKDEAWQLFQTHAGEIKEPFLQVAQEIRDECYGLPVAIKAVASFLRVKKELDDWTDARDTLKDHTKRLDIEEGMEDHYRCLKRSFDELKDAQEVSLFLLCALFPNDSEIAIELLIRFAFGLGIFLDVNSYRTARSKVRKAIGKFKNYCLLLQEGQHVKLHDMFHALALWEAKKKTQVIMGPEQIVDLTNQVYMKDTDRLYCHGIEEFPDQLSCPELDILVVSNNGGYSSKFPDMFFKEMMNLKVLAIKNTSIGIKPDLVIPPSIEGLKKLRTLCLRGWALIKISMFEKLEMLDTIELLDCVMEELPKKLANMKALKLLQVSNCKLGGDPYKVLATCSHLEELYFFDNDLPEMTQLIGQNVVDFFHQIGSFKLLQRYHLGIGGSITTTKDHSSSKLISINNFDASSITNEAFQALSQTLEVLFFEKIQGDCKSIIPDMFPIQSECLNELKEFVLHDSDCIKYLIDTTNHQLHQTGILFAKLQKLKVEAMKRLEALCHGPPPSGLLDNLKELFITNCNQLPSLFTTTTAQKMVMLEVLEVIDCGNLRYVVKIENENEDILVGPMLPSLKQISVKRCRSLKCVLPISIAGGLLQLETLEIEDAAELQYVFGYCNNEKDQNQKQIHIDFSAVKLKLINLPVMSSICPQYNDMKQPLDKPVVTGCPRLSDIFGLDSQVKQQDGDEAMKQAEMLSMWSGEDLRFNTRVRNAKHLVQATAQQARYFIRFNTFVTDLSKEKNLLISKLEAIPFPAEPSGDPQQHVLVAKARHLIEEVETLERKAEASKSCCHGVFPNLLGRYIIGKRVERMTKIMKQFNERLPVIPRSASFLPRITNRNNISSFESRKKLYNEILVALEDDEIHMIGLSGMGGCGKTTLINQVCKEAESLKLFDMVAFAVVSHPPDIRKIQDKIAEQIGLRLEEESEIGRAAALSVKLNNGDKFLIILDDICQVLKLEEVGIPLGKNCKVVLTTRHQHLCTMMGCQKLVYLSPLSEPEALILFQEHVGMIQDPLKDLALKISRECQGLPLAIEAMAKALKQQPLDMWEDACSQLRNITTDRESVYGVLKFSIDHLEDDEVRSLFFLCALFPEDSNIALEILIRFAIGLGIFDDVDSYFRARTKVGASIDQIISSSLLLGDEKGQNLRMHDMVRDMALKVTKKIQVFIGPDEKLIALTERGYMKDTTRLFCRDINEYPNQLNCPNLEFLLVSNDSGCSSEFSDDFFIEMLELKVLAIIDTSIWTAPILFLPQSMYVLKRLRTVCLRGWTLNNISILGQLEVLDTVELLFCVINELPEELAELRRLRLLEVSGCKIGSNPFEVLTRCSQLEELYFVENSLPEMESNDHNVVKLFHQIVSSKALRRYHLEIGRSIDTLENYLITKFISINDFNIPRSNEGMKNMAQKLEVLFLENVQGDCRNIFPHMIPVDAECMNELTEFLLHDSDNIECFTDTTNHPLYQATTVFSRLLKLKIKTMKCFEALCRGPHPLNLFEKLEELFIAQCSQLQCIVSVGELNFCNLKHLQLEDCPKLTYVFTYSTTQTMVSLEILEVRDCISLKQIIKDEEEDQITPVGPIFPKLKQVIVEGCPHLEFIIPESFCGGLPQLSIISDLDSKVLIRQGGGKSQEQELESGIVVPSVEDIQAGECKMEGIFQLTKTTIDMESESLLLLCLQNLVMENLPYLRYIQEGHKQLLNLRRVRIYKCRELKCIFSLRMMTYISALRELIIEDCSQLEQIIKHDYSDGQYAGPFSEKCNLQKIIVKSCPKLGSLFTVLIAKTLRLMMTLKIEDCPRMKVLLKDGSTEAYKRKEIIEEVGGQAIFPNLSFLSLKNLPELTHACEGGELKAAKGVMFPESFNLSNLQSLTLQSCPRLRSLFTIATAKTLMWLTSLEIIECSGLECVVRGKSKKIAQRDVEEMLPKLNILLLVKLPSLIIIHRGIKLQCELCIIQDCPKLKHTLAAVLKLDDLPQEYESAEEEEDYHDDDGKDMDRREEQHKEVKSAILEDDSNVYGQKSFKSCQEIKELDEADVDSLSPTMGSSSSEVVAIHQNKEVPSHTGLTRSNEDRGKENQRGNNDIPRGSIAAGSNFHLLKKDGTDLLDEVQAAEEVHPHTQEGLQKQKFCPVDSINLQESSTKIGKGSLHKDTGPEESKVGTSTQELIDKQPEVEIDVNVAKVQDTKEVHPQSKEFDVVYDIQEGLQQQNSCSFGAMNSTEVLIEKHPQIVLDPQQALQEYKASLPLPGQSTMTSPSSTSITNTSPTSDAQVSSSKHQHQIAEFEALVKATGSHINLMKQDGTSGMLPEDSNNKVQGDFEFQPLSQNFDAVVDIQEQHLQAVGSMNSRESTTEIVKGSLQKDPASEESTRGSSSQDKLEGSQMIVDPQQVLQENKVSVPLPVDPTVLSPSTSITTSSSSTKNQRPPSEEFVDFHGLFKIKETQAHLLEEAFVKYPHLWQWKLAQKTLRICKVGYKSLANMLTFLKSETPKTMNDSKMEEFENLYYEVEYFGFDKMWLASIRQRVMDMQADHNNKLKQLDHLESQIGNLEEQLSDARESLASVKDDLSKPGHVFGF